jgi:hypothetical protein
MKIQTFIYDLNSFLAVCYLGTLNSKTRRPTEIICSTKPDWGYFEWTQQIISINPYKLIQTFFVMILKNIFIFSK